MNMTLRQTIAVLLACTMMSDIASAFAGSIQSSSSHLTGTFRTQALSLVAQEFLRPIASISWPRRVAEYQQQFPKSTSHGRALLGSSMFRQAFRIKRQGDSFEREVDEIIRETHHKPVSLDTYKGPYKDILDSALERYETDPRSALVSKPLSPEFIRVIPFASEGPVLVRGAAQSYPWRAMVYVDRDTIVIHEAFLEWLEELSKGDILAFRDYLAEVIGHENMERDYLNSWVATHRASQKLFPLTKEIEAKLIQINPLRHLSPVQETMERPGAVYLNEKITLDLISLQQRFIDKKIRLRVDIDPSNIWALAEPTKFNSTVVTAETLLYQTLERAWIKAGSEDGLAIRLIHDKTVASLVIVSFERSAPGNESESAVGNPRRAVSIRFPIEHIDHDSLDEEDDHNDFSNWLDDKLHLPMTRLAMMISQLQFPWVVTQTSEHVSAFSLGGAIRISVEQTKAIFSLPSTPGRIDIHAGLWSSRVFRQGLKKPEDIQGSFNKATWSQDHQRLRIEFPTDVYRRLASNVPLSGESGPLTWQLTEYAQGFSVVQPLKVKKKPVLRLSSPVQSAHTSNYKEVRIVRPTKDAETLSDELWAKQVARQWIKIIDDFESVIEGSMLYSLRAAHEAGVDLTHASVVVYPKNKSKIRIKGLRDDDLRKVLGDLLTHAWNAVERSLSKELNIETGHTGTYNYIRIAVSGLAAISIEVRTLRDIGNVLAKSQGELTFEQGAFLLRWPSKALQKNRNESPDDSGEFKQTQLFGSA